MEEHRIFEKIFFVTGNAGKAKYLADYFHIPVDHVKLDLPEIQSFNLRAIVTDKAAKAHLLIKQAVIAQPVLVEDVSLSCEGLGGLPGPFVKWFLEAVGREGICRLLDGKDRSAVATVAYCLSDGQESPPVFT